MSEKITVWPRPLHRPSGRAASVVLFAFATGPVDLSAPLDAARFGLPGAEAISAIEVREIPAATNAEWFDGWRTGAQRHLAERDLPDVTRLDAADRCFVISGDVPDPADLGYLQGAWAYAQWLVDRGCFAVLDAHSHQWWDGAGLAALPGDRPFALYREVNVIAETTPSAHFGHAVHTRGMAKFGRPDLIAGIELDDVRWMHAVMNAIATQLAEGALVEPGQVFGAGEGRRLVAVEYEPDGNGPDVELNNDALLLLPA